MIQIHFVADAASIGPIFVADAAGVGTAKCDDRNAAIPLVI